MWGRRRSTEAVPNDILVVCTGNVCRSPYIAALLRARHPGLTVASAGIGALVGYPPTPPILTLLEDRGVPDPGLVAQQVTPPLVAGARLLLCATAVQRTETVLLDPTAADRSFTLKELARLLRDTSPTGGGLDGLITAGQAALRTAKITDENDDLGDPFQKEQAAYDQMAERVDAALAVIDAWL